MKNICRAFGDYVFGHLKLSFCAWDDLAEEIRTNDLDLRNVQKSLFEEVTVRHSSRSLPVCPLFRRQIAQWMKNLVKEKGGEDLEEHFANWCLTNSNPVETKYIYKTYESGVVLLEENRDPMGQGTTGLISWQGALILAAWAETLGQQHLSGAKVLELGSGLGLFGLTLIKTQNIREFIFSDCHGKVLSFLRLNAALNLSSSKNAIEVNELIESPEEKEFPSIFEAVNGVNVKVLELDWTNFESESLPCVDIITASDVVYSLDLIPGLCNAIYSLLVKGAKMAFVACTKRNGETVEKFLQHIQTLNMSYEISYRRKFSSSETILTNHEPLSTVTVYKIILKR